MDKIYFSFPDITTDLITAIGGNTLVTPVTAKDYVYGLFALGSWRITLSARGVPVLETDCTPLTDMNITVTNGITATVLYAQSNFIGGRPVGR